MLSVLAGVGLGPFAVVDVVAGCRLSSRELNWWSLGKFNELNQETFTCAIPTGLWTLTPKLP